MSRAQARRIEDLQEQLRAARTQAVELTAEMRGEDRGRYVVAEQLARDIRLGALREEQHRVRANQNYGDLQRALRIVVGHILDVRETAESPETAERCELLRDQFEAAGIPLRPAFIALQVERAESAAKVSASEAAAVIASTPDAAR